MGCEGSQRGPTVQRRGRIAALAVAGVVAAAAAGAASAEPPAGAARPAVELAPSVPGVPAHMPAPFAVMAFENRSGVQGLGWMSAGAAFLVGEKAEVMRGLRPAYGSLVVPPGAPVAASASAVAGFARKSGARWVLTGWVARPNWDLRLAVALWRIDAHGGAHKVAEAVRTGEFARYSDFAAAELTEVFGKAGMPPDAAERAALEHTPSSDFYAYTLFGRALSATLGTEGPRDLDRALKVGQRAVFIDPKMCEAQRLLAQLYAGQGKDDKARGRLAWALSLRPSYYPAVALLAQLAQRDKKGDQAVELYEQALRLRPWDLEVRYQLGKLLWNSGDADGAFREMSRVIEHRPSDVRARRVLVLIHASRGDNADLVKELEAVSELDPRDEATRMDLAAAYAAVGRTGDAIRTYKKVVAVNPHQIQALKFLGDLSRRKGDTDGALGYYNKALKTDPDDPRAYFLLGAMYTDAGNDRLARRIYQKAERFKKFLPETYNNLSAIAYREHHLGEALWYSKRAVAKRPSSARFRYNYALALSASRLTDQALAQIDKALAMEPNQVELHYLRGVILLRKGQAGSARAEFEKTLALDAKHQGARHNIQLLDELARRARHGEIVIEGHK